MPFIVEEPGPPGLFGVLEDDGTTGYLYLYAEVGGIKRHLHVYNRSEALAPTEEDVFVVWSRDLQKCGVVIWSKMRGIIDLSRNLEGRMWMETRDTPGIRDAEWLAGFEEHQA